MNLKFIVHKENAAWLAALVLFTTSAYATVDKNSGMRDFNTHWEILMPAHGVYLGDKLPDCTDASANFMAYKTDKSLWICAGREVGWEMMHVE